MHQSQKFLFFSYILTSQKVIMHASTSTLKSKLRAAWNYNLNFCFILLMWTTAKELILIMIFIIINIFGILLYISRLCVCGGVAGCEMTVAIWAANIQQNYEKSRKLHKNWYQCSFLERIFPFSTETWWP